MVNFSPPKPLITRRAARAGLLAGALGLLLGSGGGAQAQAPNANSLRFSSTTGGPYSAITGGTVLGGSVTPGIDNQQFNDPATVTTGVTNSNAGPGLPIGFNFPFGVAYSSGTPTTFATTNTFAVNANGWISLGNNTGTQSAANVSAEGAGNNLNSTGVNTAPISAGGVFSRNAIAALAFDLQGQPGSELSYKVIGSPGSQTLVVQWRKFRRWFNTSSSTYPNPYSDDINFQIRLNEADGSVEFAYGTVSLLAPSLTGISSSASNAFIDFPVQVGIRTKSSAFDLTGYSSRANNVPWYSGAAGTAPTATTFQISNLPDWTRSVTGSTVGVTTQGGSMALNNAVYPPSGLVYRWAPLTTVGLVAPIGSPTSTLTTANFTAPTGSNTVSVRARDIVTNSIVFSVTGLTGSTTTITGATAGKQYDVEYQYVNAAATEATTWSPPSRRIVATGSNAIGTIAASQPNTTDIPKFGTTIPAPLASFLNSYPSEPVHQEVLRFNVPVSTTANATVTQNAVMSLQAYRLTFKSGAGYLPLAQVANITLLRGVSTGRVTLNHGTITNVSGNSLPNTAMHSYFVPVSPASTTVTFGTNGGAFSGSLQSFNTFVNLGYGDNFFYVVVTLRPTATPGLKVDLTLDGVRANSTDFVATYDPAGDRTVSNASRPSQPAGIPPTTFTPLAFNDDFDIAQVKIGSATNNSIASLSALNNPGATQAYNAYTGSSFKTFNQGDSYTVDVNLASLAPADQNSIDGGTATRVAVYIDYDNDGIFAPGELAGSVAVASFNDPQLISVPITIPTTGVTNTTNGRMRVIAASTTNSATDPFGAGSYSRGETEDYRITLAPAVTCPSPTITAVTNIQSNQVQLNFAVNGPGVTFDLEYGPAGFTPGTGTTVTGLTAPSYNLTGLSAATAYDFYLTQVCSGANGSSTQTQGPSFTTRRAFPAYGIARNTGIVYTGLNDGGSTAVPFPIANADDNLSNSISVGFPFTYMGSPVTNFKVSTNGFLTFNTALTQSFGGLIDGAIGLDQGNSPGSPTQIVAPFWQDLSYAALTDIRYSVSGSVGSRVLTVMWRNARKAFYGAADFNFEVKLYETSNNVAFEYGTMSAYNGSSTSLGTQYRYVLGLNGNPTTQVLSQQVANSTYFDVVDPAAYLNLTPACNSSYLFNAGGSYSIPGVLPTDPTAVAYDEAASALDVTGSVALTPATSFCTTYTVQGATVSVTPNATCAFSTPGSRTPSGDVWLKFTTTQASTVVVAVTGSYNFIPTIQVYNGALSQLPSSCVSAYPGFLTERTATFNAGSLAAGTYYVRVADNRSYTSGVQSNGTFAVNITAAPVPANDEVTGTLPALNVNLNGDAPTYATLNNAGATTSSPAFSCGAGVNDVWFTATVPATGKLFVDTRAGSLTDAIVQVYSGTPASLVSQGCSNDQGSGLMGALALTSGLTPGSTVYIRVGRVTGTDGTFQIGLSDRLLFIGLTAAGTTSQDNFLPALDFPALTTLLGAQTLTIPAGIANLPSNGTNLILGGLDVRSGATYTQTGATLTVNGNVTAVNNLILNPVAKLAVGNGGVLNLGISVVFETVPDLTILAGGATLASPLQIKQLLTLNGNFTVTGQTLILLSDAANTAMVVNSGGVVIGTVNVQRYVAAPTGGAGLGYRHFSAPISNAPISSIGNYMYGTFTAVYGYTESLVTSAFDEGWVAPGSNATMVPGKGYTILQAAPYSPTFVGDLNNGDVPVTFSRTSGAVDAGWNFVGNPYPSPLQANNTTGVLKRILDVNSGGSGANLQSQISVWKTQTSTLGNAASGGYVVYTASGGTTNVTGANSSLLPMAQGFFLRRNNVGTTTIPDFFQNSQRPTAYTTDNVHYRPSQPTVTLKLTTQFGAGYDDETRLVFDATMSAGNDNGYDGFKLRNVGEVPSIGSLMGADEMAINALPLAATTVPLTVTVNYAGAYKIAASELLNLPTGTRVYLLDALTGTRQDLMQNATYATTLDAGTYSQRFALVFAPAASPLGMANTLTGTVDVFPNPVSAHQALTVRLTALQTSARTVQATLVNALGQTVARQTLALTNGGAEATIGTRTLSKGVYTLKLTAGEQVTTHRVVID